MKYLKPAKTFEEQAEILLRRGLIADCDELVSRLRVTNYFRLSGYLYPFRKAGSDEFRAGTTLEEVWQLYTFDQRLRTLLLDAMEAIEVYTRTQLAYHFAHDYGLFAHNDASNLPNLIPSQFQTWQSKLNEHTERSRRNREEFVVHFFNKYGDEHSSLPIWTLIELMDFGCTLTFFRGVKDDIKKRLAGEIGQSDVVMKSWLLALNTVRNRCAHHARLWNWKMGTTVLLPQERKFPKWHAPRLPNDRVGIILTICRYWINEISPSSSWPQRVQELFEKFPTLPLAPMGLPEDWRQHPLWKD